MRTILKAWLHKNQLTKEPHTYLASIEAGSSFDREGIIDELQKEGLELKRETVLDVITRFQRKAAELAVSGHNVNTGLVHMRAAIRGVFHDDEWIPEQQPVHVAVSQDKELRDAIAEVKVEILGKQQEPIEIMSVTDTSTGKNDGTLTKGYAAEIKGYFLKIEGEDPNCGVTFTEMTTRAVTKIDTRSMVANEPSKLIVLLPATMSSGQYELAVTTQFNRTSILKHPRTAVFDIPVIVGS